MKTDNIHLYYQLARKLRSQELSACKKLTRKIIKIYKPHLRSAPNLAGDHKIVCVIHAKTGKFDEIFVKKDLHIMGYFGDGRLMTDGYGGAIATESLKSLDLPTLLKVYEITKKLFNKGYKTYKWE